jgi:hypothetical protein
MTQEKYLTELSPKPTLHLVNQESQMVTLLDMRLTIIMKSSRTPQMKQLTH